MWGKGYGLGWGFGHDDSRFLGQIGLPRAKTKINILTPTGGYEGGPCLPLFFGVSFGEIVGPRVEKRAGPGASWGVYTSQWGVLGECTLPSGDSPLGSIHSPMGSPHWGEYTPQWGVPTGECTLPIGESTLGTVHSGVLPDVRVCPDRV